MFERRSIKWPITLGVVMIVLLVVLTVGWVLLAVFGGQWTWLSIGTTFLAFVLAGVIMYLVVTVKAINLSRRQSNFIDSVTHELKSPIASLKLYVQTLKRRQLSPDEQSTLRSHLRGRRQMFSAEGFMAAMRSLVDEVGARPLAQPTGFRTRA